MFYLSSSLYQFEVTSHERSHDMGDCIICCLINFVRVYSYAYRMLHRRLYHRLLTIDDKIHSCTLASSVLYKTIHF